MLGSVVLDVAIGMTFVFLLLSLIASAIHEFLATLVQARAANLCRGMLGLFSGGTLEPGVSFVEKVYNHGLIQGLYRDNRDFGIAPRSQPEEGGDVAAATSPGTRAKIPLVPIPVVPRTALQWLMRVSPFPKIKGIEDARVLPSYIPSRTFALAIIDLLNQHKSSGAQAAVSVRSFLAERRQQDPHNKAIEALLALSIDAGDDLASLQCNIENWYNDAMDRVSGWYKRNTQYLLLAIGLLLAVAFNVNSVEVAQTLWFDRDLRQTMVDAASKMQEQAKSAPAANAAALEVRLSEDIGAFKAVTEPLLPVGWKHAPSLRLTGRTWEQTRLRLFRLASIAAGWLITALAISLGAPFWFDSLNKFMVVRGTIKPQEKSRLEASKDPSSKTSA